MTSDTVETKAPNLSIEVVETLKERIVRWEYPPGYRFTEEELCQEFGVSRSPVREALRTLAATGFVAKMPHRGYQVKQLAIREIDELYEVRLALELFVVDCVAERGLPKEVIDELKQTWRMVLDKPGQSSEELAHKDVLFHETLAKAMGNKTLLQQLQAINERLFILRMLDFTSSERIINTCQQHLEILERILAGDVPGARKALQRNIEDGRNNVETTIKEALARAYLRQGTGL